MEGYIDALKRGCRCCELDCWDGENGEVCHANAKCSMQYLRINNIFMNLADRVPWLYVNEQNTIQGDSIRCN